MVRKNCDCVGAFPLQFVPLPRPATDDSRLNSRISPGHLACFGFGMAKNFREMVSWQLAFELEEKTTVLVAKSAEAKRDFEYRNQLMDACQGVPSNIAEGFGRYRPAEIARFLDIAMGCLNETETRLRSGVLMAYFKAEDVGPLILLAARCRTAMNRWNGYLQKTRNDPRFLPKRKRKRP